MLVRVSRNPDKHATETGLKLSLASRRNTPQKNYLRTLSEHGYEIGTGVAGQYADHYHRGFTDLAYCPAGLRLQVGEVLSTGILHLAEPRVWLRKIQFDGPFFFMKYFAEIEHVCPVPDKYTHENASWRSIPAQPALIGEPWQLSTTLVDPRSMSVTRMKISLDGSGLRILSSGPCDVSIEVNE